MNKILVKPSSKKVQKQHQFWPRDPVGWRLYHNRFLYLIWKLLNARFIWHSYFQSCIDRMRCFWHFSLSECSRAYYFRRFIAELSLNLVISTDRSYQSNYCECSLWTWSGWTRSELNWFVRRNKFRSLFETWVGSGRTGLTADRLTQTMERFCRQRSSSFRRFWREGLDLIPDQRLRNWTALIPEEPSLLPEELLA